MCVSRATGPRLAKVKHACGLGMRLIDANGENTPNAQYEVSPVAHSCNDIQGTRDT